MQSRLISSLLLLFLALASSVTAQGPLPSSQLDPAQFDPQKDPDIDLFIGHWKHSMPRIMHRSLVVRDILTRCSGDPMRPARKGAVLTETIAVSRAILAPGNTASNAPLKGEQHVFYVDSGSGVITSGGKTHELRRGIGFIITPGLEFTMTCTGEEPLAFYMLTEPTPAGFSPNRELRIRDTFAGPVGINVHWANIDRSIISQREGMAVYGGLTEVTLDAMTMAQPHSHNQGTEEIWIAVEGDIRLQFGKQFRDLPVGSAYRIPWDGITAHANVNLTGKPVRLIHMMKAVKGETSPWGQLNPKQFNPETDPSIDLFMGDWRQSMPRLLHGGLVVRDMLTRNGGDPLHPNRKGAVLTGILSVSRATLYARASTAPSTLTGEQQVFYVDSGTGVIRAGKQTVELRPGIGILVPAGLEFVMTNTGDKTLDMYLIAEPLAPGFTPRKDLGVTDEYAQGLSLSVHWSNMDRGLFGKGEGGLSTIRGIGPVMIDAMTMAQPHSHGANVEEIWFALDGDISLLFGKQLRNLPVGTAYRIPPDGMTAHANINASDRPVKLMCIIRLADGK